MAPGQVWYHLRPRNLFQTLTSITLLIPLKILRHFIFEYISYHWYPIPVHCKVLIIAINCIPGTITVPPSLVVESHCQMTSTMTLCLFDAVCPSWGTFEWGSLFVCLLSTIAGDRLICELPETILSTAARISSSFLKASTTAPTPRLACVDQIEIDLIGVSKVHRSRLHKYLLWGTEGTWVNSSNTNQHISNIC